MDRFWLCAAHAARRRPRLAIKAGLLEGKTPTLALLAAYPAIEGLPVELGTVAYRNSNLEPGEQFTIAALAKLLKPKRIFEFGTYDGATTLLLARNAPDSEVLTIDLPSEAAASATVPDEIENVAQHRVGSRFRATPEDQRITQFYDDSRRFDFTPWLGTVDLVFIDGGHEYRTARSDTLNALRLRSPRGIVVWDDYSPDHLGVMRAVDELAPDILRLHGTEFAVFDPA